GAGAAWSACPPPWSPPPAASRNGASCSPSPGGWPCRSSTGWESPRTGSTASTATSANGGPAPSRGRFLPAHRRHPWLDAEPGHDLLHEVIVPLGGANVRDDRRPVLRVGGLRRQAVEGSARLGADVAEDDGADEGLVRGPAGDADAVVRFHFGRAVRPELDPPDHRPEGDVDEEDGGGGDGRLEEEAGPGQGADGPAAPDGGGGGHAADREALA